MLKDLKKTMTNSDGLEPMLKRQKLQRNYTEILELKSTIIEMKSSQEEFNSTCEQAEESITMKTRQFILAHCKNRKKKEWKNIRTEPKRSHQTYKYTHHGNSISGEENEVERILKK